MVSKLPPLVLGAACTAFDLIPAQTDEITAASMSHYPASLFAPPTQHGVHAAEMGRMRCWARTQ